MIIGSKAYWPTPRSRKLKGAAEYSCNARSAGRLGEVGAAVERQFRRVIGRRAKDRQALRHVEGGTENAREEIVARIAHTHVEHAPLVVIDADAQDVDIRILDREAAVERDGVRTGTDQRIGQARTNGPAVGEDVSRPERSARYAMGDRAEQCAHQPVVADFRAIAQLTGILLPEIAGRRRDRRIELIAAENSRIGCRAGDGPYAGEMRAAIGRRKATRHQAAP